MISAETARYISENGFIPKVVNFPREIEMKSALYYLEGEIMDVALSGYLTLHVPFEPFEKLAREGLPCENELISILLKKGFTLKHSARNYEGYLLKGMLISW